MQTPAQEQLCRGEGWTAFSPVLMAVRKKDNELSFILSNTVEHTTVPAHPVCCEIFHSPSSHIFWSASYKFTWCSHLIFKYIMFLDFLNFTTRSTSLRWLSHSASIFVFCIFHKGAAEQLGLKWVLFPLILAHSCNLGTITHPTSKIHMMLSGNLHY